MKKLFLILALSSAILNLRAQENPREEIPIKKHEITISVGLLNDVQLMAMVGDLMATVVTAGYLVQPGGYSAFSPSISYRYWFGRRFGLGASYTFDVNSVKIRKESGTDADFRLYKRYYSTIAVEGVFNYMNRPYCQLYGMLGFGVSIATIPKSVLRTVVIPNGHLMPIGVRVGRNVGAIFEFGFGYKGFINAGLSVKF
jgi:hypothetical protein